MDKSSDALLALEPVTFQYKPELDPEGVPQFGLVPEQVEKVAPQLVVHDKEGKPYTVRYDAVNAMLLNEFLKEHRKATAQQCKVAEQGRAIRELTGLVRSQQKQIDELTAGLQRVSDEVQLAKPGSNTIAGN